MFQRISFWANFIVNRVFLQQFAKNTMCLQKKFFLLTVFNFSSSSSPQTLTPREKRKKKQQKSLFFPSSFMFYLAMKPTRRTLINTGFPSISNHITHFFTQLYAMYFLLPTAAFDPLSIPFSFTYSHPNSSIFKGSEEIKEGK